MPEDKRIELAALRVGEIRVPIFRGGDYQRAFQPAKAAKIERQFCPLWLGALQVAWLDGAYWVWDGQHRLAALRALGHKTVPCLVAFGYQENELALAFGGQGLIRTAVSAADTFRAMLVAQSSVHLAAMELIEHYGYQLDMSRSGGKDNALKCHGAIASLIRQQAGLTVLEGVLRVLHAGWPEARVFQGETLTGIATFWRRYYARAPMPAGEKGYFETTLISVLAGTGEKELARKSRELTTGSSANFPERIGVGLRVLYNQNTRKFKLA